MVVHEDITGDLSLRKGFATYYTEIPAAYLLASLAVKSFLDVDIKNVDNAETLVRRLVEGRYADFACGSGTLLTALYHALMRTIAALILYHDLDFSLDCVGKKLIEEGIYGIDALRYAAQITAINLALLAPGTLDRQNIYTIYLGYIKQKDQAWLGSLELLRNGKRVGGLLAWIERGLDEVVGKVTINSTEGVVNIPDKFDIIIMNPPFTRATGRTEGFEGEGGLFGFILDQKTRDKVVKSYNALRKKVREDLIRVARELAEQLQSPLKEIVLGNAKEFSQYFSIGQAGEGLLFLYLAYKYVKDGGVIAFVLPRNLLSGISWFLARTLLSEKFHVKYVVVSSEPDGYNFSENTKLSEALIVARRVDEHDPEEETVFVNLLKKPRNSLEATIMAEKVAAGSMEDGIVIKVKRHQLLNHLDNWNRFTALPDPELMQAVLDLLEEGKVFGRVLPLVKLNTLIKSIGVDSHQFHDSFKVERRPTAYPALIGGEEDVRRRMLVAPNAYVSPKNSADLYERYRGRILLPDRIWWDTAHVVALYSDTPVLSNIFYAVNLAVEDDIKTLAEKALVLWLNTTWGMLSVLASRQETRGRWTRLKMAQWRLLPVLDVTRLDRDVLKGLADVFDEYANKELDRIPHQFDPKKPDPARLGIDVEFLNALRLGQEKAEETRQRLLRLYEHIYTSLIQWIR